LPNTARCCDAGAFDRRSLAQRRCGTNARHTGRSEMGLRGDRAIVVGALPRFLRQFDSSLGNRARLWVRRPLRSASPPGWAAIATAIRTSPPR
jgi:hypothetical protein